MAGDMDMGVPVLTMVTHQTTGDAARGRVYALPRRRKRAVTRGAFSSSMVLAVLALFLVVAIWQSVQIGRLAREAEAVGAELARVTQERARIIGDFHENPEMPILHPLL
jgi:hypothetical protein